jgi:hypothetical protein
VNQVPEPITRRNARLPAALDAVFARALSKAPEDRYPSAEALSAALRAAAAPIQIVPANVLGRFVADQFPDDRARAERLVAEGRTRFERLQAAMIAGDAARLVPGHTGAAPTRLGSMSPLPLGLRGGPEGGVRNAGLAAMRDERGQATRVALRDELGTATQVVLGDDGVGDHTRTAMRDELDAETRVAPTPEAATRAGYAAWGATAVGPGEGGGELGDTWIHGADVAPTRLGMARGPAPFTDPSEASAGTTTRLGDTRLLASPFGSSTPVATGYDPALVPPRVDRRGILAVVGVVLVAALIAAWVVFGGHGGGVELEPLVEAPTDAPSPTPDEVGAVAAVGAPEAPPSPTPRARAEGAEPTPSAAPPRASAVGTSPRPQRASPTPPTASARAASPSATSAPTPLPETHPAGVMVQSAKQRAQADDEARASVLIERARRLVLRHGAVVNPRELSDADRDTLSRLALDAEQLAKKVDDEQVRTRIRVGLDGAYQGRLEDLERALSELKRALAG